MIDFSAPRVKGFELKNKLLVLASTSPYRRELLARLRLPFEVLAPQTDESPLAEERAPDMALRLASAKARSVAERYPAALIIGSDQVAVLDDALLGKPGTHENAVRQLKRASGREIVFYTALCLLNAASGGLQTTLATNQVKFRSLSDAEIERYLRMEQPYDCAGSAKCEGLGIALLEYIRGDDPNALIGLPLIALTRMLRNEGAQIV
jgi:septum formation protein